MEQQRADVVKQRKEWQQLQSVIDETKLVFIDETWAKTNMTTLYGWAPMGRHVVDGVPHGHCYVILFGNNFYSSIAL